MKLLGWTARQAPGPELDNRLHDIFDDRRTPGAPEALYRYLGEIAMDSVTGPERGRRGLSWGRVGRVGRVAAVLAVLALVGAGLFAATVGVPRGPGSASGAGGTAGAIPAAPAPPAGWSVATSFGTAGPDGLWGDSGLTTPSSRIAIDVACNGPDDVVVLASTVAGGPSWLQSGPVQAATFSCSIGGSNRRVEMVAAEGGFQEVAAVVIRSPSSIVDTSFRVSIEVPDANSSASPSLPSGPTPSSVAVSPAPSN